MQFPHVDPIPIPAPVWLMKVLSLLTLTLHLFSVQILIGSLLAVIYFNLRAKGTQEERNRGAALVVARRLPIVMTYVINLGVPPLLFAQVLYGRALYTSSVLIGAQWIAVIFLVIAVYWLLYRINDDCQKGKATGFLAFLALVLAALVGHIYATNMTLMLRPEVWQEMYAKTATGLLPPPHDPTTEPRLMFVLAGGFLVGGLWVALHGRLKTITEDVAQTLHAGGAAFAVIGALAELGTGYWAYSVQPSAVTSSMHAPLITIAEGIWALGFAVALLLAIVLATRKNATALLSILGALGAFLGIAGGVIVRDGIRDTTLAQKGFDVWNRTEASNWSVIGLFLLLFVLGLAAVGWLLMVMRSAKPVMEKVNS